MLIFHTNLSLSGKLQFFVMVNDSNHLKFIPFYVFFHPYSRHPSTRQIVVVFAYLINTFSEKCLVFLNFLHILTIV